MITFSSWTASVIFLVLIFSSIATCQENEFPNEIPRISKGSCAAAGLCCKGRDSSCVLSRAPPNSIIEDLDDVPCYCDHYCMLLKDCCSDFKHACGVQDCQVSNWGGWSTCDAECGLGTMTRSRDIVKEPRNGGNECPSLIQKRGCRGRCQNHKSKISVEDIAIILPIEFSEKRKLNQSSDITRHLRLRYARNPDKDISKPYCVEFEVIRSTRACKSLESFISLQEGNQRICVLCESEAKKSYLDYRCSGTGSNNGILTKFSSLFIEPSCHGKWKHISSGSHCPCTQGPKFIFI